MNKNSEVILPFGVNVMLLKLFNITVKFTRDKASYPVSPFFIQVSLSATKRNV